MFLEYFNGWDWDVRYDDKIVAGDFKNLTVKIECNLVEFFKDTWFQMAFNPPAGNAGILGQ